MTGKGCCTPGRPGEGGRHATIAAPAIVAAEADPDARPIRLEGGEFLMGSQDPAAHPLDREGPVRPVRLSPFSLDAVAISNRRFLRFVEATGYRTEAEIFGWSFVFFGFLPKEHPPTQGVAAAPWWRQVFGAWWREPEGPGSHIEDRLDHPVTHISYADALSFCAWVGGRLPTEAEWEFCARGGLVQQRYPWGDELMPGGRHLCNIWQGEFPHVNTGEDGHLGTAPVDAYEPNGLGFLNMVGNAWEWCADWFDPRGHGPASQVDPKGPPRGQARVMRGGSYLCHASYCFRYRVSARSSAPPDSGTGHIGFRMARD
jgi:formylglycine-generating enzyme required for sulfatase activity